MKDLGFATLSKENIAPKKMKFSYSCDIKYEGQFHEIEIPMPMSDGIFTKNKISTLIETFDQKHDVMYGYNMAGTPVQLTSLRVVAEGIVDKIHFKEIPYVGEDASSAIKGQRRIYYDDEFHTVPIYNGAKIGHGNKIAGPAIIEEATTTILLTPDYEMSSDKYNNYLIYPQSEDLKEIISSLKK